MSREQQGNRAANRNACQRGILDFLLIEKLADDVDEECPRVQQNQWGPVAELYITQQVLTRPL